MLHYTPTQADPDIYIKMRTRVDGTQYYSYLVVYVDDILCVDEHPKTIMDILSSKYTIKGKIEFPEMYLGSNMRKWTYSKDDGTEGTCYAMGSHSYIKEAIRIAE